MIYPLHFTVWQGIVLELALLASLMAGITFYQRWSPLSPETSRKLFHIGGGLTTLTFPWIFTSSWPVILLALITIPSLLALKYIHVFKNNLGTILYRIDRTSFGEIYLPLGICLLFVIVGNHPLLFTIPVLILTLADPTAAIVGGHYGRLRYLTIKGQKSIEGSAVFFLVAFFCIYVPSLLFTDAGRVEDVLVATLVALLVMLVEAVSWNGLDNLLIPLSSYFLLLLVFQLPIQIVLLDLVIVLSLLITAYLFFRSCPIVKKEEKPC
jgi:phytol kinase